MPRIGVLQKRVRQVAEAAPPGLGHCWQQLLLCWQICLCFVPDDPELVPHRPKRQTSHTTCTLFFSSKLWNSGLNYSSKHLRVAISKGQDWRYAIRKELGSGKGWPFRDTKIKSSSLALEYWGVQIQWSEKFLSQVHLGYSSPLLWHAVFLFSLGTVYRKQVESGDFIFCWAVLLYQQGWLGERNFAEKDAGTIGELGNISLTITQYP